MKNIALNTIFQIAGKAISVALGVIITVILTRYLGPKGFGDYTFVLVFVTMFGVIGDWGLSLITVREASKDHANAGEIISNVLVLRLILSVVACVVACLAILFLPYSYEIRTMVFIFSFFIIASSIKTSLQIIFNVKMVMHNWAVSEMVSNVVFLIAVIIIVNFKLSLYWILLWAVLNQVASILVAGFLGRQYISLKFNLSGERLKNIVLEALPMGGILILFTVYNRMDTVILSYFKGSEAVGYYGAAYKIFEVLVLPAAYFANSVLPLISKLAITDKKELNKIYSKSLKLLFFGGILVCLGAIILAPFMVNIIAGRSFTPAVFALQLLSLALVVSYLNHLNGYTIIALGKQKYSFYIAIFAFALNLVLNLIFIPLYSFPAAAVITFITEAFITVVSIIVIKKEINYA